MLPKVGLEPTLLKELESKPNVSTYFTTLVVKNLNKNYKIY